MVEHQCVCKCAPLIWNISISEISLDVDADRDGVVERNNPNKVWWSIHYVILFVTLSLINKRQKTLFVTNILGVMEMGSKWAWCCPISQLWLWADILEDSRQREDIYFQSVWLDISFPWFILSHYLGKKKPHKTLRSHIINTIVDVQI